jgi:hypothetical protein
MPFMNVPLYVHFESFFRTLANVVRSTEFPLRL